MDTAHLACFLRSLATTPSRRGVARALTGFTLAWALNPLLGLAEADAKRHKKKKRRRRKKRRQNEPFCAGKNTCVDGAVICGNGVSASCQCLIAAETGEPVCGDGLRIVDSCGNCNELETCVDLSGVECGGTVSCTLPCPDPL